ncbi:hypothetical protein ON010_g13738 [Phytophthora cinnamomi]|nr:hypothetical protein ON010_g13738 [Phytophthora cinnamomi]
MTSTIRKDSTNSADAAQWRREANRQREIALQFAKEYQLAEKTRRAEEHNARLRGKERKDLPNSAEAAGEANEETAEVAESAASLHKAGDQVWLFMERVKPGLKKKLASRWHGLSE